MNNFHFIEAEINDEYIRRICGNVVEGKRILAKIVLTFEIQRNYKMSNFNWIIYLDRIAEIRTSLVGIPSPPGISHFKYLKIVIICIFMKLFKTRYILNNMLLLDIRCIQIWRINRYIHDPNNRNAWTKRRSR